jgi:hypothetical protein
MRLELSDASDPTQPPLPRHDCAAMFAVPTSQSGWRGGVRSDDRSQGDVGRWRCCEPKWARLTISVGPKEADLVGSAEKAIQAAVDMAQLGGGRTGTRHLSPTKRPSSCINVHL